MRSGDTSYSLWDGALASATSADADATADRSEMGDKVNFLRSIVASVDKKTYSIATSFTPNIKLATAAGTSRAEHMIVLPDDKDATITFTMTMALRLYSDTTQTFERRRRLLYRDASVPLVTADPVNDIELQTSPVNVKVPGNVQISTDGSVTVISTPATLSVGAIAGIAAIGAAVAAASIGLAVVVVRKHKQTAAAKADAEAALVQQGSTEFMIKEQKLAPFYPINTRVVA